MKTCPVCRGGRMVEVDDIVNEMDGYFFVVKGMRCNSCGDELIDEYEGQKMIKLAKRFGLWGEPLKLHRKLSKSARGTVLRIPVDLEKELRLKGDEEVAISKVGKRGFLVEME
jgi:YgiT-type zinc finger domain-containing protein